MDSERRCYLEAFKSILTVGGNDSPLIVEEGGEIINYSVGEVKLTHLTIEQKLNFKDVKFNEHLHFKNCVFDEIEFVDVLFLKSVIFEDCICKKTITFTSCSHDIFNVVNCEFDIIVFRGTIKESRVGQNTLLFEKGTFSKIEFKAREIFSSINFKGCNVQDFYMIKIQMHGSLSFDDDFNASMLALESCDLSQRLDFVKSKFETIYIRKVNLNEQVVFQNNFSCKYLTFSNTFSARSISIDYLNENVGTLDIDDCRFDGTFNLNGKGNQNEENKIQFNLRGTFHGILFLENLSISPHLNAINFGTIHLDNIVANLITFQGFYNHGKLTVSNIVKSKYYSCLIIYDSNIQFLEFINADFREFNEVVIAKSNVSNILLSNSFLPRDIETETKEPKLGYKIKSINSITDNSYKRENYRQLKIAMENISNRNESLQYKAREMYYLRKEQKFGWDKVLLNLNFISNNNGLSWARGIFFTIFTALFFFLMYEYSMNNPYFYWTLNASRTQTIDGFKIGIENFLKYMASFPNLRFDNDGGSSLTNLIVLLSRIFIGYGIYQTITAFRKYGGK